MAEKAERRGKYLGHVIYFNPLSGWYAIETRAGGFISVTETRETLRELKELIRECVEWERFR